MSDYDLHAYGCMLTDEARMTAYAASIRAAVRPGDVVLELGTATGVMALLACQCGAKRVYALEPSDVLQLAKQAAKDNGFEDRIVFIRAFSTQIELPEKCDVLISDLRGATPCFATHLTDLMDARERLLKPDARWVCQADTLLVGVVEVPNRGEQIAVQWDGARWDLDLRSTARLAHQQMSRRRLRAEDLLGPGASWAQVNYPTLTSPHVRGSATLPITRNGPAHGLSVWFSAELFGEATFTNGPGESQAVYTPLFLPWEEVVELRAGDTVDVSIDVVFSGHEYWWNWTSAVRREGLATPLAHFKQSTFKSQILNAAILAEAAGTFAPTLTPAGEEAQFVLARLDGRTTQAALASGLREQFPKRFPDAASAIARVSQIRRALG